MNGYLRIRRTYSSGKVAIAVHAAIVDCSWRAPRRRRFGQRLISIEPAPAHADRRQLIDAARQQSLGARSETLVARVVASSRKAGVERDAGRGGGLREDLRIVEIEPATEREPAGREREPRTDP